VPTEFERIVRKTLEKNPSFRYQSARRDVHRLAESAPRSRLSSRTASVISYATEQQPTALLSETNKLADVTALTAKLENAVR